MLIAPIHISSAADTPFPIEGEPLADDLVQRLVAKMAHTWNQEDKEDPFEDVFLEFNNVVGECIAFCRPLLMFN